MDSSNTHCLKLYAVSGRRLDDEVLEQILVDGRPGFRFILRGEVEILTALDAVPADGSGQVREAWPEEQDAQGFSDPYCAENEKLEDGEVHAELR